jgi:gliding motility-associated-like protein
MFGDYAEVDGERDPVVRPIEAVKGEREFFVPNTFTPNGDGRNDLLKVYGNYMATLEFRIFNQWGELIFYTNDLAKGWDGKINGRLAPGGPYAYWAKGKDENGEILEVRGYFNLVR